MRLSDEKIKELLQWFVDESESYKEWGEKRRKASLENHEWIQPHVIQSMSDVELEKKFLHYYNTDAGYKQRLNKLNRDRIIRDKAKFRETAAYLLNESVGIAERIDEVLGGKHRILGFGRGIITSMLMDFNVEKYAIWNKKTEMGMNAIGMEYKTRGDSQGVIYLKILEQLKKLISLMPEANLNFDNIDFFLHVIAAEEEGINKLKEVVVANSIDYNLLISNLLNEPIDLPLAEWKQHINEPIQDFYAQLDAKIKRSVNFEVKSKRYARGPDSNVKMRTCLTRGRWLYENSNLPSKRKRVNAFVQLGDHSEEKRDQIFWGINWWGIADDANDIYKLFEKLNIDGNLTKHSTRGLGAAGTTVMTVMKSMTPQEVSELEIDIKEIISSDLTTALKRVHDILPEHEPQSEKDDSEKKYWWLIANPKIWKFYEYNVGQRQIYTNRNEKGNKSRIFEHFNKVKPGDLIFCYSAAPDKELVGKSKVTKALHQTEEGEGFEFEIIEKFKNTISWSEIQKSNKLKNSEPILHNNQGSLFKLAKEEFDFIQRMIDDINPTPDENDDSQKKQIWEEFKINLAIVNFKNNFEIKSLHFENRDQIENKIELAIKNDKHIILIGPPGTGKSKLAKEICEFYCGKNNYFMSTATSDWSTFETIGGYRPDSDGKLYFNTGIFLKCFQDQSGIPQNFWLIIDEINRADIDKAFGFLFSSLTGDDVSLPFDIDGDQLELIGDPMDNTKITKSKFIIHPHWRIIATMNTFDKTSLYEMSYAFMRRFAFVPIDVPTKINSELIEKYIDNWGYEKDENICRNLSKIWDIINRKRKIGPAIIQDLYNYSKSGIAPDYSSGIIMYVLPQFEGLLEETQIEFIKQILELDFVNNREELKNFASEYFGIDRRKLN